MLRNSRDPFEDPEFEASAEDRLVDLARLLHEGASVVDVRVFPTDSVANRRGRKWTTRDRRVAEKVVIWYQESAGE